MKKILGFSNRWDSQAFKDALEVALPNGIMINVVSPVYFWQRSLRYLLVGEKEITLIMI